MDEVTCEICEQELPRWAAHTFKSPEPECAEKHICPHCRLDVFQRVVKEEVADLRERVDELAARPPQLVCGSDGPCG